MSSVRVRRGSHYTTFRADDSPQTLLNPPAGRPRSHTLAGIFDRPGPSSISPSADRQTERISHTRPRSGSGPGILTTASEQPFSRVFDSIMKKSSRVPAALKDQRSRTSLATPNPSQSSGQSGTVALHGPQAELVMRTDGHLGRIGSALSLASGTSGKASRVDDDHHEDDIVEHLDVIDPRIATVSNLSNAANAILIPPIGVYSRRPVIFLPKHAIPTSKQGEAEKGKPVHEDDLDRHVEEVLGKRAKFRRTMEGVGAFLKTPIGIIAAIYGFLCAFWGAAIIFFLVKFINLHNASTQGFWVEVSSQIENALFTVTGIGLIPWRVLDTYRILRIWYYKKLTRKLRQKAGLPELYDEDDLPDPVYDPNYVHVLNEKQQNDLHYQQQQFMKSQTWYRPHGTETHRAFPINTALIICCFVDGNSIFQCMLCGVMWGLNRFQRPAWTTGSLIPASFMCGITAAVLIWRGGQKTKRTKEVEERLRMALAMEHSLDKSAYCDVLISTFPNDPSSRSRLDHPRPTVSGNSGEPSDDDGQGSSIYIEEKMNIPNNV